MFRRLISLIIISFFINFKVFAADISIVGTVDVKKSTDKQLKLKSYPEKVVLLKLNLTDKAKEKFADRFQKVKVGFPENNTRSSPSKIDLGMDNVPVLNQGNHGSCVMFSVTAAIDAAIGEGDYVSQLCQLGLGRYLENHAYTDSGWDGTWGRTVLSQMEIFGIASKDSQRQNGCSGLKEYPMGGQDLFEEESIDDFHAISEPLSKKHITWTSILDVCQATSDSINQDQILRNVKMALQSGNRVTFGTLLLKFTIGSAGAVGSYKEKNDSWIITPEIAKDIDEETEFAGHSMVIIGYDDNAEATDSEGRTYKGLLKIRNSWGPNIGDKGNFYMSYNYFKGAVLEAHSIRNL